MENGRSSGPRIFTWFGLKRWKGPSRSCLLTHTHSLVPPKHALVHMVCLHNFPCRPFVMASEVKIFVCVQKNKKKTITCSSCWLKSPHTGTRSDACTSHTHAYSSGIAQYCGYSYIITTHCNYIARTSAPIFEFISQLQIILFVPRIFSLSLALFFSFNFEFTVISGDDVCISIYNDPIWYAARPNRIVFARSLFPFVLRGTAYCACHPSSNRIKGKNKKSEKKRF